MSGIFFNELKIKKPNYNLGVSSLSHGAMTGRQLEKIEKILINESPDLLLVYGDTNSTLSGALAAAKAPDSVEFVSPYTNNKSGDSFIKIFSIFSNCLPVIAPCDKEETPRL